MRKTVIALTLLLVIAALVPTAFAAEAPAAAPALAVTQTAPRIPSTTIFPSQSGSDFVLWLQAQTGQIATPATLTLCPYCQTCFDRGYDCCQAYTPGCYCCFL
jgi:hypothetical protein